MKTKVKKRSLSIVAALLFAVVAEAGVEVRSFAITAPGDGTYNYTGGVGLIGRVSGPAGN